MTIDPTDGEATPRLARVTYLPGVVPPAGSVAAHQADVDGADVDEADVDEADVDEADVNEAALDEAGLERAAAERGSVVSAAVRRVAFEPVIAEPDVAEPGIAGFGNAGFGTADLENADSGNVDFGNAEFGNADSGNADFGKPASPVAKVLPVAKVRERMDEILTREVPSMEVPETDGERSARAHNISMHALTRKGMSSAEMTALLKTRDLDAHDVEFEVARLEQVGLLDDRELASTLVRTLRDRKGLGRSAINAELRRRKVDADAIEEALEEAYPSGGDDELTRAREIAMKRAPQLRSLDAETARRRLGAFLMRKGYSGSVIASAVASALASNAPTSRGPRFE
jgi:regulatory protein